MILVTAYVRPHKLEEVKSRLVLLPISGMTVSDARGCGNHPEKPTSFFGMDMLVSLPIVSKVQVAVDDQLAEDVIEAIRSAAETGQEGDGKIFIEPLINAVRIRTSDTGPDAL